jgi:hypothetical protein
VTERPGHFPTPAHVHMGTMDVCIQDAKRLTSLDASCYLSGLAPHACWVPPRSSLPNVSLSICMAWVRAGVPASTACLFGSSIAFAASQRTTHAPVRIPNFLCAGPLRGLIREATLQPYLLPLVRTSPRTSLKEGKLHHRLKGPAFYNTFLCSPHLKKYIPVGSRGTVIELVLLTKGARPPHYLCLFVSLAGLPRRRQKPARRPTVGRGGH